MTTISIDIDGVLARHNLPAYITSCVQHLNIEIAQEELASLSYRAFLELPTVQLYQQRIGVEAAKKTLGWEYFRYEVLVQANVIEGALEGVHRCSEVADVCYCTARYSEREQWNQGMQIATAEWLAAKGFPNPERIIFCQSYRDKMLKLARMSQERNCLHIDDSWKELVQVGCTMPVQFVMIAFGAQAGDVPDGCIALPEWSDIDGVIGELREKGYFDDRLFKTMEGRPCILVPPESKASAKTL